MPALREMTVAKLGDVLASAGPGPAAGSTAAVTASLAAGLAGKVARAAAVGGAVRGATRGAGFDETVQELDRLRRHALVLADDDVEAFAAFLEERKPGGAPGALEAIVQVPADIVTLAVRVAELSAALAQDGPAPLYGDATTAAFLAAAAAESAAGLVGGNLADEPGDPRPDHCEERAGHARALAERLV